MASNVAEGEVEEDPHKVSFRGRALKVDTEEDAQVVIDQIDKCEELVTLELAGNTFGVEGASAIANALEDKKFLKNCLWSDMFTSRLRNEIPPILSALSDAIIKANTHLVVLDLSHNAFGPDGIKGVKHLLTSPACYSIQELYFNNNGLGEGGAILAEALIECHANAKQAGVDFELRTFVCGRNRIENERAKPLSEAFTVLKTLEVIRMPQNGICHAGITDLAESFEHNPNLTEIDLDDNTVTAKGARALSQVLPKLLKLKIFKLGDCIIRDDGAILLCEAFTKEHTSLEIVKLDGNEIKTDGGIALTDIISTLPSIKSFNLNTNELGNETINDIKAKMRDVGKYEVLDSFSDDEGDDSHADNADDDDANGSQDVQAKPEPYLEKETAKDDEITLSVDVPSDDQVATFLTEPSLEKLKLLGSNCIPVVLLHISRQQDAEFVAGIMVRMSTIWPECEAGPLRTLLIKIITAILAVCTKDSPYFSSQFVSYILTHMGMLKSEDKKFKPLDKLANIMLLLSEIITAVYFSKMDKEMMLIFLQKPHPKLLACPTELSILIGRLFE